MKHPSENFIKALLIQGLDRSKNDEELFHMVKAQLELLQIPLLEEDIVYKLIELVKDPVSRAEIRVGLYKDPDAHAKQAILFASEPAIRRDVEILMIGNATPDEIIRYLAKSGYKAEEAALEDFRYYFFNKGALTPDVVQAWAVEQDRVAEFEQAAIDHRIAARIVNLAYEFTIDELLDDLTQIAGETIIEIRGLRDTLDKVKALRQVVSAVQIVDNTVRNRPGQAKNVVEQLKDQISFKTEDGKDISITELPPIEPESENGVETEH